MTLRGKAQNYRHCDSTWTFVLNECELKLEEKTLKSKHCKIVAFDTALSGDPKKPPVKADRKKEATKTSSKKRRKEDRNKAGAPESEGVKREKLDEAEEA